MATRGSKTAAPLTLGEDDEGRFVSAEEFAHASYVEPWRYERVHGRLVVMAPDGGEHVVTTSPWLRKLFHYQEGHPEVVDLIVPSAWVRIDGGTDRIGDIGVYLPRVTPAPEIPDRIPELMFEIVSPGSEARDRDYVEKRGEYHRLGIQEYIVVDRFRKTVTVFTHSPDGYEERVLTRAETYESSRLPGLAIPLAEVFRP